jgi:ferredoxin
MDGSGRYFIRIDTDKCDGCGDCVSVCPAGVMLVAEDENDPFRETPVAKVVDEHRKKIKYSCGPCKPVTGRSMPPCIAACKPAALEHSW